jgi:hypothetical protein
MFSLSYYDSVFLCSLTRALPRSVDPLVARRKLIMYKSAREPVVMLITFETIKIVKNPVLKIQATQ